MSQNVSCPCRVGLVALSVQACRLVFGHCRAGCRPLGCCPWLGPMACLSLWLVGLGLSPVAQFRSRDDYWAGAPRASAPGLDDSKLCGVPPVVKQKQSRTFVYFAYTRISGVYMYIIPPYTSSRYPPLPPTPNPLPSVRRRGWSLPDSQTYHLFLKYDFR